jgi:hypothetical protein
MVSGGSHEFLRIHRPPPLILRIYMALAATEAEIVKQNRRAVSKQQRITDNRSGRDKAEGDPTYSKFI